MEGSIEIGVWVEAAVEFILANFGPVLDAFAAAHDNAHVFTSLGHLRYLSMMAQAKAVVGNSSSGLYEAPALGVWTLNVGSRQQGRERGDSVVDVAAERGVIETELRRLLAAPPPADAASPYGDGHAAARIAEILKALDDPSSLMAKRFHDLS